MGKFLINNETKIVGIFVFSRIVLFLTLFFLLKNYLNIDSFINFLGYFAHRWDGNSYTFIAKNWYVTKGPEATFIVFPPLYPLLIKVASFFFSNLDLSAFFVSNVSFLLGIIYFYRLLKFEYGEKFAFWSLLLLIMFPTSYFFSAGYPESLLFLLFCLAFYFVQKKRIFAAAFISGLATLTRPFGILFWPALFLFPIAKKRLRITETLFVFIAFCASVGFYLAINKLIYGDFFQFQVYLKENWYKSLGFPWKGIVDTAKRVQGSDSLETKIIFGYSETAASLSAWIFVVLSFLKKFRVNAAFRIYYVLGVIMFTSTSFILSAPRYLLSLPPFFIILAGLLGGRLTKILWVPISVVGLFVFSYFYAMGHWAF